MRRHPAALLLHRCLPLLMLLFEGVAAAAIAAQGLAIPPDPPLASQAPAPAPLPAPVPLPTDEGPRLPEPPAADPVPATGTADAEAQLPSSPEGAEAVERPAPLLPRVEGPIVVVDAGHGGINSGAFGPALAEEKQITLTLARQVKALIEDASELRVALTREQDVHLGLKQRASVANQLGAALLLSIHCNSASYVGPRGHETYFFAPHAPATPGAADRPLTDSLQRAERLARLIEEEMVARLAGPSRGVRAGSFDLLIHSSAPAVVVEVGFLNHPQEGPLLSDPAYQERVARALASGVLRYMELPPLPPERPFRAGTTR